MKVLISEIVLIGFLSIAYGQVCSPIGQICTKTTDCCKGCCEAHTCVDRPYSCSTDLVQKPGFASCIGHFCPIGHLCYLRDVCPPENPCPRAPSCRRFDVTHNYTVDYTNSIIRLSPPPSYYFTISTILLMMSIVFL